MFNYLKFLINLFFMKYSLPPFNEKPERGFFEQKIIDFSSELFKIPIIGISLLLIINLLYLYAYFKSRSIISILLYLFLAYLIISLILSKVLNLKRNK